MNYRTEKIQNFENVNTAFKNMYPLTKRLNSNYGFLLLYGRTVLQYKMYLMSAHWVPLKWYIHKKKVYIMYLAICGYLLLPASNKKEITCVIVPH